MTSPSRVTKLRHHSLVGRIILHQVKGQADHSVVVKIHILTFATHKIQRHEGDTTAPLLLQPGDGACGVTVTFDDNVLSRAAKGVFNGCEIGRRNLQQLQN